MIIANLVEVMAKNPLKTLSYRQGKRQICPMKKIKLLLAIIYLFLKILIWTLDFSFSHISKQIWFICPISSLDTGLNWPLKPLKPTTLWRWLSYVNLECKYWNESCYFSVSEFCLSKKILWSLDLRNWMVKSYSIRS